VDDGAAEVQAALHAAAEPLHRLARAIGEADPLEHLEHPPLQLVAGHAVGRTPVGEVVPGAEVVVQGELLGHDAE
jgi:hypothetical protein